MTYTTNSVEETEKIAEILAKELQAGAVVAFSGDLGAGKTAFTRGIARGLGIEERVTSPTFTLVQEYEGGRLPLFHFDLYRLEGEDAFFDLGFEEYFHRKGVCVLEWSSRAEELLSEFPCISIKIQQGKTLDSRQIDVTGINLQNSELLPYQEGFGEKS